MLYDNNQSPGRCLPIPNPAERFRAFGCEVIEVDGHDLEAIKQALVTPADRVRVIVCNTVKGYGCGTLAGTLRMASTFAEGRRTQQAAGELHASAV